MKALLLLFSAIIITSCSYKMGKVTNPKLKDMAITVTNLTQQPNLAQWARINFQANLFQQSGINLALRSNAKTMVIAKIENATSSQAGISRNTRTTERDDEYSDFYTATSFQGKVVMSFEVYEIVDGKPSKTPLIPKRIVEGQATVPYLADTSVAINEAFKAAVNDATNNMLIEISEAW